MSFKFMFKTSKIRIACLIFLLSIHTIAQCVSQKDSNYKLKTIVLDAGHGGHDTGCNGQNHSFEKDVTLKIVLLLGKMIEEKYPDIKVLYTRKTDVFITLQDRALLANKNDADLFISVHCNANANKSAYGTETFIMGLHVSQANLDVAKRENSVIKLEDNYEKTYDGFDPDSPEAMIALSLAQNANIEQSSFIASKVQEYLTNQLGRFDRGVKQAGFWVLYRTICPSILIETGFLTNSTEEKFLTSESGQKDITKAIFHAFDDYKTVMEKNTKVSSPSIIVKETDNITEEPIVEAPVFPKNDVVLIEENNIVTKGITFKVQIKAMSKPLSKTDKAYKVSNDLGYEKLKGTYKYLYGPYESYNSAQKTLVKAKNAGYSDAFIVVYKNGERLSFVDGKNYFK